MEIVKEEREFYKSDFQEFQREGFKTNAGNSNSDDDSESICMTENEKLLFICSRTGGR